MCGPRDGTNLDSRVFVQTISFKASLVAAGGSHSMVLKQDGSIWATGSNEFGQFGDNSAKSENIYIRIFPLRNGT